MEDPAVRVTPRSLMANPFWVAVFMVWIVMLIIGFTLALALGIWTLIGAFG